MTGTTTARGFEPLRAEPNGFLVHHLNHSVTLSWICLCLSSVAAWRLELLLQVCMLVFKFCKHCIYLRAHEAGIVAMDAMQAITSETVCRLAMSQVVWAHFSEHPWSSGYDVSLTRWRSPVRTWPDVSYHNSLCHASNDSEGIRTPAGRAQWISSPSP